MKLPWMVMFSAIMTALQRNVDSKLPCQTSTAPRRRIPNPDFVQPNLCCGSKPFNSGFSTCCMGRPVDRSVKRCCISGNPVPRESKCSCVPSSNWIREQSEHLYNIELRFRELTEVLQDTKMQLIEHINNREEVVKELDARANALYRSFLDEINIARNQDPEEVQYIYDLVTFLHSNEEEESNIHPLNEELEREGMEGRNDAVIPKNQLLPEEIRQYSLDTRGLVNRLINSSILTERPVMKSSTGSKSPEINKPPVSREIGTPTKKSIINETQENLNATDEAEVERIILERNSVVDKISLENEYIISRRERLQVVEKILQMFLIDTEVILQLREFLDIIRLENEEAEIRRREEEELERETEDEGSFNSIRFSPRALPLPPSKPDYRRVYDVRRSIPAFDYVNDYEEIKDYTYYIPGEEGTKPTESTGDVTQRSNGIDPGCNVDRWTKFISNFTERAQIATFDLQDILIPSEEVASNRPGEEPLAQNDNSLVNGMRERAYNWESLSFHRLSKHFGFTRGR